MFHIKFSIKRPGGLFISNPFEAGHILEGGLFNLLQTMVSVLHKELEYTVEKLQVQEVGGRAAKDKKKSQLPVGE